MNDKQTKDISDEAVCKAFALYQYAMKNFGYDRKIPSDCLRYPYEILQNWFDAPFKVCWRAMERAVERDLVDYGVSLRTGWLTPKGEELLKQRGPEPQEEGVR